MNSKSPRRGCGCTARVVNEVYYSREVYYQTGNQDAVANPRRSLPKMGPSPVKHPLSRSSLAIAPSNTSFRPEASCCTPRAPNNTPYRSSGLPPPLLNSTTNSQLSLLSLPNMSYNRSKSTGSLDEYKMEMSYGGGGMGSRTYNVSLAVPNMPNISFVSGNRSMSKTYKK